MFKKKNARAQALMRQTSAEFVGAFLLSFMVALSVQIPLGVPTPVIAGLTLGLIVYLFGSISGAHANPAITIALWSLRKIESPRAIYYVIAQLVGGFLTWIIMHLAFAAPMEVPQFFGFSWQIFFGEAGGAAILALGVCAVVMGNVEKAASGLTIGGALLLGALFGGPFSGGMLNPAVSIGLGAVTLVYLLSPIIGTCLAMLAYRCTAK